MGRYDAVRYWNGSQWVKPSEMKYWNGGSWVSYGADSSTSSNGLKIWNGSSWVQALYKQTTVRDGEKYVYGPITHSGSSRTKNNAYAYATDTYCLAFSWAGYVYGNPGGTRRICGDYITSVGTTSGSVYSDLYITSGGYLQYRTKYNGSVSTVYSSQYVSLGAWHYIEAMCGRFYNSTNNYYLYFRVDSGSWMRSVSAAGGSTIANPSRIYCNWTTYPVIGDSGTAFKGTCSFRGTGGTTTINIANGTYGSVYSVTSDGTWVSSAGVDQYTSTSWTRNY